MKHFEQEEIIMTKITQEQLTKILASHGKWWRDEEGGQRAYLRDSDLRGAYLRGAYLQGADLQCANLQGADLPTGVYQIVGCGSVNRCTTYDSINDCVICGCWNDNAGNHLAAFRNRIETIYGVGGSDEDERYYREYMAAVVFFETIKEGTII